MVKFTDLRRIMDRKHNIRNISVIADVNHGKSTLTDSLMAAAGHIAQETAGDARMTDAHADEAQHGITTKSTCISLYYEMSNKALEGFKGERHGNEYLVNLLDSPGHIDFSSEVTAALRITDGALLVVDCLQGALAQTESLLTKALCERIRPVLTVNKMDRCFFELKEDGEQVYQKIQSVIEHVNVVISTLEDSKLGDLRVYPEKGTVAFSAGLHGWAFTLTSFVKLYAAKFDVDESQMMERLWGENFFDTQTRKWSKENTGSATCKRGFDQFCYLPIKQIIDTCMSDKKDDLIKMLASLDITLESEEKELMGEPLMKRVMQKWFPAATALLEMTILRLPSPHTAQKYRVENLYTGPLNDIYANAIRDCNPDGPLMLYVSKMIPASDKGGFLAFGRVFSGKVSTGMKVRIMGPNFVPGQEKDLYVQTLEKTLVCMGKKQETVEDVPCGNTVAIVGLDKFIKNATLTSEEQADAHPICSMKFSVSQVVRVEVCCIVKTDLPKLIQGLKRLAKSNLIAVYTEESGGHFIGSAGELHLHTCFKELQEDFVDHVPIMMSDPIVTFYETVEKSNQIVMSKSLNKHNYLHMEARPIGERITKAIDEGRIGSLDDPKACGRVLAEEFEWDQDLAKNIWCFGPETTGPNMLVDMCKGVSISKEIVTSFQNASEKGVLAEEKMRGICFVVHKIVLHNDVKLRAKLQIKVAANKAIFASQLAAGPRLLEPVYLVQIQSFRVALEAIPPILEMRRASVIKITKRAGTNLYDIKVKLPVAESFGFDSALRLATRGLAWSAQCVFDHWGIMPGDPLDPNSVAGSAVASIRERKGLRGHVPPITDFEG